MMAIGAVDIGGTKIAVGMVDEYGTLLSKMESPTGVDWDYATGLEMVADMLRQTAHEAGREISGIGIGSTGPVHPFTGQFGDIDFLPKWRGRNPVRDLARIFKVRVALENDGDASALAEASWGSGKNKPSLIYVTIGTGIGGGIISHGKLYRGVDASHPEIGHHIVDPSGPLCSCGFRGCWESLASGPAMAAWVHAQVRGQAPAGDPDRPDLGRQDLDARRIYELAAQGDPLARSAVQRETRYLGLGLANLINLFVPDAIVLGGSVMKGAGLFLDEIRAVLRQGCRFVPWERVDLTLASLGDSANLIGAARVWLDRYELESSISQPAHVNR
jgi:glucokinase